MAGISTYSATNDKKSDSKPVPSTSQFEGYVKGYEKVTINEAKRVDAKLTVDTREIGEGTYLFGNSIANLSNTSEYDTDTFKYGSRKKDAYDDPTYLGFELYFDDTDEKSPFFAASNTNANKVMNFLNKYSAIPEIKDRIPLLLEFNQTLFSIFNSVLDENSNRRTSKNYYIQSIKGTDAVVNKKIINYPEDKITITLSEDVTMTAQYLAELYNNLVYSYKSNRCMIPSNLLMFDLHIKVNDMRKFRSGTVYNTMAANKTNIPRKLEQRSSYVIYTLHDCTFDFFDSKNSTDELVVGGFGASAASTPATLSFDIRFKSVSKIIEPVLKQGALSIFNKEKVLHGKSEEVDYRFFKTTKIGDDLYRFDKQILEKYLNPVAYGMSTLDKKSELKKKKGFDKYLDKAKGAIKHVVDETKDTIIRNIKEKRDELINRLISQIKDKTSIMKVKDLGNVYDGDNRVSGTELKKFGNKLKNDIIRNIESDRKAMITQGSSAMTNYIANFDKKIGF